MSKRSSGWGCRPHEIRAAKYAASRALAKRDREDAMRAQAPLDWDKVPEPDVEDDLLDLPEG